MTRPGGAPEDLAGLSLRLKRPGEISLCPDKRPGAQAARCRGKAKNIDKNH